MQGNLRCKDGERLKGRGQQGLRVGWGGSGWGQCGPKAGGTLSSVFSLSEGTVERPALGHWEPRAS